MTPLWRTWATEADQSEYASFDRMERDGIAGKRLVRQRCLTRARRANRKATGNPEGKLDQ